VVVSCLLALPTLSLLPSPAFGGGSWIEFDPGYAMVGQTITMRGAFSDGQLAPVSAGPWYAYLRADPEQTPNGPSDVSLGEVEIRGDGGYPYVAIVTFTVPAVPSGAYWVDVCDLGCSTGVGDLIGGYLWVGQTMAEARLLKRASGLEFDVARERSIRERLAKQRDELKAELRSAKGEVAALSDRLDLIAAGRAQSPQVDSSSDFPWPVAALVALAGLAGFVLGRRGRRALRPVRLEPYPTRTLVTGASRSAAENHDRPASPEPKTAPEVAPK
jgi:MYXO-CTERM domain-containing protein